jgi:hypothetical protein
LRFGVYILQDAPLSELRQRWREAEALGFDHIWLADHTRDFRREGRWFDAWATLAVMAVETTRNTDRYARHQSGPSPAGSSGPDRGDRRLVLGRTT